MSKIRTDYVTNSSSSSFVIAKKNDCSMNDIEELLRKNINEIKETLSYFEDEYDGMDETAAVEEFISDATKRLFNMPQYGMQIENWLVTSNEFSNEDEAFGCFMYDYGTKMVSDKFQVGY